MPTVGATPSSGTGTIVPPTSSVTPPSGSSGGIVPPAGPGGGIKPLDLDPEQEKGVKKILREIYGPAMSLQSNAELNAKEVEALTSKIEDRSRVVAEREVTTMYQGYGMSSSEAKIRANLDMREVRTYQNNVDMTPVDRIGMNTEIAVGAYTGAIKPKEWTDAIEKTKEVNNGFKDCSKAWGGNKAMVSECGNAQAITFDNTTQLWKNNTFKLDKWVDNQLGQESKTLVQNAEDVSSNHINRAVLNYDCKNIEFGLYIVNSPSVVAYAGLGWGVQTNASVNIGLGGPWNSVDLQLTAGATKPSWSLGAGAYTGASTISPSISNRPLDRFIGNSATFSINLGIGPASGGVNFTASNRGEFLLNVTPPVAIGGIPVNPGIGAAINLSGSQGKCGG